MDESTMTNIFGAGFAVMAVVWIVCFVLGIIITWKIVVKAGYNGALSLLMLIPLVNFVLLLVFAFSEWPVQKELKQLKGQARPGAPGFPTTPR